MEYRYEFILAFYSDISNSFSLDKYRFGYTFETEFPWDDDFDLYENEDFLRAIEIDVKIRTEKNELAISFLEKQYKQAIEFAIKYFQSVNTDDLRKEWIRFKVDIDQLMQQIDNSGNLPRTIEVLQKDLLRIREKISTNINEIIGSIENKDLDNIEKIEWLGTQKELGELFVELKKKGYIEVFNYATIKACFTNSNTINQILKPDTEKTTYQPIYPQIYTPKYKSKFEQIKQK